MQYVLGGVGAIFALTVVNPNYINRKSWYLRKFSVMYFTLVGYSFGKRYYIDAINSTMLRNYDYYPLEVKRALQDKDYRHFGLFD